MSVRDDRLPPFAWLALSALERIREQAPSSQAASTRNVYMALAESASRAYDGQQAAFKTTRAQIAHLAGVSTKTVDRCCALLVEIGLLAVDPVTDDAGRSLASTYRLIRSDGGDTKSPPRDTGRDTESPPITRTGDLGKTQEGVPTGHRVRDAEPVVKFKGRKVSADVSRASLDALALWNERTGQTLKPFDGQGETSGALKRIVGAMLKHPEVVSIWAAMIDRALINPWWRDDAPSTAVVFGPNVVERMIQQAQRPAIAASSGNVHAFPAGGRPSKFDVAQAGLAALHAQYLAEDGK